MDLRLKLLKITFSHDFSPGFQKHKEIFVTTIQSEDKIGNFLLILPQIESALPQVCENSQKQSGRDGLHIS